MSIWTKEVIRVNGNLMAYIEVQDDWTGNIRGCLRKILTDDNGYYVRADGCKVYVDKEREQLIEYEEKVEKAFRKLKER